MPDSQSISTESNGACTCTGDGITDQNPTCPAHGEAAVATLSEHARSIRSQRASIGGVLIERRHALQRVELEMRQLADTCHHENQYTRHHYDGESSTFCADCGRLLYG